MSVLIDFLSDWKEIATKEITQQGYSISSHDDVYKLTYSLFNLEKRRIALLPRSILEADTFNCPSDSESGYEEIKKKILAGNNICPHLSKSLLKLNYEDALLNDWGIHHFHLGLNPDSSGFIERTGPLLFAYVTNTIFYSIGIYPHGLWSLQDLIRIIHRNWPAAIECHRIKGILGLSRKITDSDVSLFRKNGIQTFVEIEPGVVYAPIGGGYSTAKTSLYSGMRADKQIQFIIDLQDKVIRLSDKIISKIKENGGNPGNSPKFKLLILSDGYYALEINSLRAVAIMKNHL